MRHTGLEMSLRAARLAVAAVLLASAPAGAQSAAGVRELDARFQLVLDSLWEASQETDEIFPGATAAFVLPDGSVHAFSTGWSDVEAEVEMEPDMLMPSGSIGKTYVAATAISMAQDGVLGLDDPISKWLGEEPWFDRLPNGDDITLRMLLNHSGGLIDHAFDSEPFLVDLAAMVEAGDADAEMEPRELVRYALDQEPLFAAGQGFNYTDTGYIVIGLVIEKASGGNYYDELRTRVLEPHGLADMTLPQDRRDAPRLAQGYGVISAQLFGTPEKVVGDDGRLAFHPGLEWTGGGLYNNSQALARWARILYEGDAFEEPYLDELLGSISRAGDKETYGLGVLIQDTPLGTTYGHSGFFPGYNSVMIYFPDQRVAVAMQINTDRSQFIRHGNTLAAVVLEAVREAR